MSKESIKMMNAIMEASFDAWFSSFQECSSEIGILALEALFDDDVCKNNQDIFVKNDLKTSIDALRGILAHPSPQNRNDSTAYYYNPVPDSCLYKIQKEDIQEKNLTTQKYILKNGSEIPFSACLYEHLTSSDDVSYILAQEPIGLLGLTKYGSVAKADVVVYLREKFVSEKSKLQRRQQDIESIVPALLSGLTTYKMPEQDVTVAISQLTALAPLDKEIIIRKMSCFFQANPNSDYIQQVNEKSEDYSNRIIRIIILKINENKQTIETEAEKDAEYLQLLKNRQQEKTRLEQELVTKKSAIINCKYFDSKLKDTAQKYILSSFLLNYAEDSPKPYGISAENQAYLGTYSKEEVFKSYSFVKDPDDQFWEMIKQYKEIAAIISSFKPISRPANKKDERGVMLSKMLSYQQWFKCLRLGKFLEARQVQDNYKKKFNGKIDFNATDEWGKSPFYYALVHDNAEFMCSLVLNERITIRKEDSTAVPAHRKDIRQAIDTHNWDAFLNSRIKKDIENLLREGSQETLSSIFERYAAEGFVQVYAGKEWRGKVGDVLLQVIRELALSFNQFHYGWIKGDLEFYEKAFSKLGENFKQIKDSAFGLDVFVLQNPFDEMMKVLVEVRKFGEPEVSLIQMIQSLLSLMHKKNAELGGVKDRFVRLENEGIFNSLLSEKQKEFDKKLTNFFRVKIRAASQEERDLFKEVLTLNKQCELFDRTVRELDEEQAKIVNAQQWVLQQNTSNKVDEQEHAFDESVVKTIASEHSNAVVNSVYVAPVTLFSVNQQNNTVLNKNFLKEELLNDEAELKIDKAFLSTLLSGDGDETYTIKRNKGLLNGDFWHALYKDGSTTITKLKELVHVTADNEIKLSDIREVITKRRKGTSFIAEADKSGTNFVLKKINDEFNRVVNERTNSQANSRK